MTDMKHTKGPWSIGNRYTNQGVYTANGDLIANTHGSQRNFDRDEQIAEQDANARLIASAPELLEALIKTRAELLSVYHSEFDGVWSEEDFAKLTVDADAAIAKAKGEVA